MVKGGLIEDTFEKLAELGVSTTKKTVKSVSQTLNPFSDQVFEKKGNSNEVGAKIPEIKSKEKSHTPLDFEKLKSKFQDKEKMKVEGLRNRLFQMVKQGDERMLMEKRQKEIEEKRREAIEEQQKKQRKEEQKRHMELDQGAPRGKIRKNIFSPKKSAEKQHAETKPATGKQ